MFQRQDIPRPVKMVAAIYLVGAVINVFYFVVFVWTIPTAWIALVKVLVSIVAAIGLLKLISGWRIFTIIISGAWYSGPPLLCTGNDHGYGIRPLSVRNERH